MEAPAGPPTHESLSFGLHDFTFNQPTPPEFKIHDVFENEFSWELKNPLNIIQKKVASPSYTCGDIDWELMVYPRGNRVDDMSIYLCIANPEDLGNTWKIDCLFSVTLVNKKETSLYQTFDCNNTDFGWSHFTQGKFADVINPDYGILDNGIMTIQCNIRVKRYTTHSDKEIFEFWRSKRNGFVGLSNQGNTCYLNSILQSLFHLPIFRRAIYRMPPGSPSLILALQRLFFRLQYHYKYSFTTEVMQTFECNSLHLGSQNDTQEFLKLFQDTIEAMMKKTPVEGTVEKLFRGSIVNYIRCVNAPYESVRSEYFYDISLNVKGFPDVYASFKKFCEIEVLQGDQLYDAEGHGFQVAHKGIIFETLPPVLHLHLIRYEYDIYTDQFQKVNDKYIFPEILNLNMFVDPNSRSKDYVYHLQGVLVHSGNLNGGHYVAYIKPGKETDWFKFNDSVVTKVSPKEAILDNYGDGIGNTSAYMLIYMLESELDWLYEPVEDSDIPDFLVSMMAKEM